MDQKSTSIVGILFGLSLIIGTAFKLKILVDPPEEWSSVWSHSWLKEKFGEEILVPFNYIVGGLIVIISILTLIPTLK